jgi:hypothetical protein
VSVATARAVFSLTAFPGLPADPAEDWDGLKLNTDCWPSRLAPNDPGWALLTNDEFYKVQHPELADHTTSYTQWPPLALVRAALQANGGNPPYSTLPVPTKAYAAKGVSAPPDNLFGVLPGLPLQPSGQGGAGARRLLLAMRDGGGNETEFWLDHHRDNDPGRDSDLPDWLRDYYEDVRRSSGQTEPRKRPSETNVEATPVWQAGPTPTAASEGFAAFADLAKPTASGRPWSG